MKETTNKQLFERDLESYLPTFKRFPLAIEKGEGATVWDVEGNKYLDMLAGIAVNNLGHCPPAISKAISEQSKKLMHISNFFVSRPQVELSEKLIELSGLSRVFLTNSGAESVEGAIKIARKYAHSKGRTGEIVFMDNAFHGRTLATIAAGKKNYQRGFGPIPTAFSPIDFNNLEEAEKAISTKTAAVIVEPIQGEGGVNPAKPEFLKGLREICDKTGTLLIFDEIQCGIGRTCKMFAKDHFGIQPDIMTLAKGLGSGMPVGAVLCNDKVSGAIEPGDHGTTFGGNPLACAAAIATLQTINDHQFINDIEQKAHWFTGKLEGLKNRFKSIVEVRGKGFMLGVVVEGESKPLVMELLDHHIIANATAGNVIRLVPPLTISQDELSHFLKVFEEILQKHEN